ncbi:MAG: recombinase RecT [Candidatus Phocaeicola excrementipullorum]|uniref:Recombinase RecT n=1 Tax=Candidatus Phocaeicola excrementipullorum TaxID=2838731 RepID=A0A948TKK8_9BACT|nr:recombinase RecT [Candidatus Phocaeicola excrementipullorum]
MTPVGQTVKQFEVMQRMAKMYTESTIIPEAYKGNIGNCIIALDMATRMGANPLMVMQNLYVVNGNPSWSSKFLIATINMSGKYSSLRYRKRNLGKVGKVKYNDIEWKTDPTGKSRKTIVVKEFDGTEIDNIECVAYATELSTGEILESDPITIDTAIKEGWYTKSGSKWVTMPSLMLTYRAAAFWQRMYCPEISMGFITKEEADDIQDAEYVEIPSKDKLSELAESAVISNGNPAAPEANGNSPKPVNTNNTQSNKPTKPKSLW